MRHAVGLFISLCHGSGINRAEKFYMDVESYSREQDEQVLPLTITESECFVIAYTLLI